MILKPYFKNIIDKNEQPKFKSTPFPINLKFEVELFQANPMDEKQITSIKNKYQNTYNYWIGALQHIAIIRRIDSAYETMRLLDYNSAISLSCYIALNHFMQYLFHHPHIPILYPRKKVKHTKLQYTMQKTKKKSRI